MFNTLQKLFWRIGFIQFILFISLLFSIDMGVLAQKHPDFHPPMDVPFQLSGTFGELRTNHFHSGIDIRTGGVEGKPVYSIGDGWVSRIRISPGGFGNAVYIDHPEGYTSVYAHMLDFKEDIQNYALAEQYRLESFDVDLYLTKNRIPVKRGERIGRSGNSGSSGGPHLHFEVRDGASQHPLDPLRMGFSVRDNIKPAIKGLKVYPYAPGATVNGSPKTLTLAVQGWGLSHRIETRDTIRIRGAVTFGLNVHDVANDAPHKNGVYAIEGYCDNQMFYSHSMDRFSFDETRYINAMIDYEAYQLSGSRYIRTFIAPNNRLSVYREKKGRGVLRMPAGTYLISFQVEDHNGNLAKLQFPVIFEGEGDTMLHNLHQRQPEGQFMTWKHDNVFLAEGLELNIPGDALYDTLYFTYRTLSPRPGCYAPMHVLHNRGVPLHTWSNLRIKADALPAELRDKALVVRCMDNGKCSDADGGWKDGWVETRIREFGTYSVQVDTVAPRLVPLNLSEGKTITTQRDLRFKTSDNLSGIKSYRLEINGKWVLLAYDPKNELLVYHIQAAHFLKGKNNIRIRVTDDKANVSTINMRVIY